MSIRFHKPFLWSPIRPYRNPKPYCKSQTLNPEPLTPQNTQQKAEAISLTNTHKRPFKNAQTLQNPIEPNLKQKQTAGATHSLQTRTKPQIPKPCTPHHTRPTKHKFPTTPVRVPFPLFPKPSNPQTPELLNPKSQTPNPTPNPKTLEP